MIVAPDSVKNIRLEIFTGYPPALFHPTRANL
jgi:hypothetical protein